MRIRVAQPRALPWRVADLERGSEPRDQVHAGTPHVEHACIGMRFHLSKHTDIIPITSAGGRSQMTGAAAVAIAGSAVLGLLVSLSMFLMIGATSGVTFNVVGHAKTVLILAGGVALFGDAMCARLS